MNSWEFAGLSARRAGTRLAATGGCLGLVALLVLVAFTALVWMIRPGHFGGGSQCADDSGVFAVPVPESTQTNLTAEQRANAAIIIGVGRELQVPDRGQWVALATALQESGLRNLDYGDRDSLGLFQQRPSQGWGTPAQVTDQRYSATQFYDRLVEVPDWASMPLWKAAQTVQRSAFPTAYAKWESVSAQLLTELGGAASPAALGTGEVPANCAPGGGSGSEGAPVAYAGGPTGCVQDDPTTGGCITGATAHALGQVEQAFGGLRGGPAIRSTGCFAARPQNPTSDHPRGRGCDFFPGAGGEFAQGGELDAGWRVAEWLRTHADDLQVSYVIWQGRIWTPGTEDQGGWGRRYSGGGVYDPDDAVGGHYDHIHVSFRQ